MCVAILFSLDEGPLAINLVILIAVIFSSSRKPGQQNSTLRAHKDFFLPLRKGQIVKKKF